MLEKLKQSPLFVGMNEEEIQKCLTCGKAEIVCCEKDETIFYQQDEPRYLHVLLEGSVVVCRDSVSGKRSIIATFSRPGELFGEVFVFLGKKEYDNYAQAATPATVLQMPKMFLYHTCGENCGYHQALISNMLSILAHKAYYLNRKLQVVSAATLRQKIARILLQTAAADGSVALAMKREELADFLNVARPSLSRELLKMQKEGLLRLDKRQITVPDWERLQNI